MKRLDYLNLEFKSFKNIMKDITNDIKLNCNIIDHKQHSVTGTSSENLMIDLIINLGLKTEKSWIDNENIIRNIANQMLDKNKLIKQMIDNIQNQLIILEEIQRKVKRYKSTDLSEIINAFITIKESKKPKPIETETNDLLKEVNRIALNIEQKLQQSIEHDRLTSKMLEKFDKNFKIMIGSSYESLK